MLFVELHLGSASIWSFPQTNEIVLFRKSPFSEREEALEKHEKARQTQLRRSRNCLGFCCGLQFFQFVDVSITIYDRDLPSEKENAKITKEEGYRIDLERR